MENNQLTLYKLMILYLIQKVDFPLSNSQISEFIIDKGYTNYFNVQRAFHELEEEEMLRIKMIRNMSHYYLTEEGEEAIGMFEYQIPQSIKDDISQFLDEKEYELRKETDLEADFFPAKRDEYTVHLKIKEKDTCPCLSKIFLFHSSTIRLSASFLSNISAFYFTPNFSA